MGTNTPNQEPTPTATDAADRKKIRGIGIRAFNGWMVIIACVLFALLLVFVINMIMRYSDMFRTSEDYISAEADAASLHDASDYLTEEVRLFAINMDVKHANNYFEEANVTRRREQALKELTNHEVSDSARKSLEQALQASNDLMQREIHSMKLIAVANGYDVSVLPKEIQEATLSPADQALSDHDKIEKARQLVFNQGYQDAKALITSHLDHFTTSILTETQQEKQNSVQALQNSIVWVIIFICLLFIMNVITFIVITMLIIRPLRVYNRCIRDKKLFEIVGSSEFKYMALTYNDIYELNAANEAMLRYKAEHDPLTGILNRESFFQVQAMMKNSPHPMALMLVDVDEFKQINDKYGHQSGDQLLKKVANLLKSNVRSTDYCMRIGGDEFAVLLMDVQHSDEDLLRRKAIELNNTLQNPDDGLPKTSLSIGIAFSPQGYHDALYKKADDALYKVKESGRCGCAFYPDEDAETRGNGDTTA